MSATVRETKALFGRMLDGEMADAEIADILVSLADKGETAEEIAGAVKAMRARMKPIKAPANAIDVCGTGGDGQHSLNVSTAVAIVVAACRFRSPSTATAPHPARRVARIRWKRSGSISIGPA